MPFLPIIFIQRLDETSQNKELKKSKVKNLNIGKYHDKREKLCHF